MPITLCTHDLVEREIAVSADGYCPLCQAARIEFLRSALAVLYADCADYIRVNNLYRSDGKSAIWNHAMKQAAEALGTSAP